MSEIAKSCHMDRIPRINCALFLLDVYPPTSKNLNLKEGEKKIYSRTMKDTVNPGIWSLVAGITALKSLFAYSYFSTDFDVHRNWLSITHSLPLSQWYTDSTSEWTLDYPPLFAWFQYLLSFPAAVVDSGMVQVQAQPYQSWRTIHFQRFSVIFVDLFYSWACYKTAKRIQRSSLLTGKRSSGLFLLVFLLLVGNAGLLLVDHIHFQYNGMLTAILLLSIVAVLEEKFLIGAFWFAVLVCMKHIYLYLAPAYAAFYLRNYCFKDNGKVFNMKRLICSLHWGSCIKLAAVLLSVFTATFGPFIYVGQFSRVLSRLFPFKRGLTHAYWAPNFWAVYNAFDLALFHFFKKLKILSLPERAPGYTSGLVEEYDHAVLPSITPPLTAILSLLAVFGFCLIVALLPRKGATFLRLLTLCAFTSYMFGWHVHEKAILLITIPLTLEAAQSYHSARLFILVSTVGHFSLFPLLFEPFESLLKYGIATVYLLASLLGLKDLHRIAHSKFSLPFLGFLETIYLVGLVFLEFYKAQINHRIGMDKKFPFLPLLLTSVYCSIGMVYSYCSLCWRFLCDELKIDLALCKKAWMKEQLKLKESLVTTDTAKWAAEISAGKTPKDLKFIGGLDISTPVGDPLNACVCLSIVSYPNLELFCSVSEMVSINKPYIPGFLAFREVDPMVSLVRRFCQLHPEMVPQVLFVDGNGLLHPRRFGLACHVGVLLDMPTVGVAKNLHLVEGILKDVRRYEEELISPGQTIPLETRDHELIGVALRSTAESKNPVFVSIGHKLSLEAATALAIQCSKHRVPEPIRHQDQSFLSG